MDQADDISGGDARRPGTHGHGGPPTSTDQLRIAAVEAAVAAGWAEPPAGAMPGDPSVGDGPVTVPEEPVRPSALLIPELPDWADPPTGQVPSVLLDAAGEAAELSPWAKTRGPTWREQAADWDDDLGFGAFDEAAEETTGVAGRTAEAGLLEGPIEFHELDDDPRWPVQRPHAAPPAVASGAGTLAGGSPAPTGVEARPPASDDGVAGDEAWAAFAAGDTARSSARPSRPAEPASPPPRFRAAEPAPPRADPDAAAASVPPVPPSPSAPAAAAGPAVERRERGRAGGRRNPLVATATGLVAGGIAVAAFVAGSVPALALVAVVSTLAAGEAYSTLRRSGRRPASLVGLLGVPALIIGAYLRGPIAVPVVLACCVVIAAIWFLAQATELPSAARPPASPAADLAATLLVLVWVGVLAAFAGLLLAPAHFPHRHGVAFVFAALVLTAAHDVGSYAAGATLGRHKVLPTVSPNKTWEGFAGGTALTFVASFGIAHLHPIATGTAVGLAALVSVLAPLGDLTESLVKRDLGVKDMGRVLPAHGGFFDRIDAMLFVLPAAYFLFRVAHPS